MPLKVNFIEYVNKCQKLLTAAKRGWTFWRKKMEIWEVFDMEVQGLLCRIRNI